MEVIREIRDLDSDKIIIKIPKEFKKKRVEILVLPFEKTEEKKLNSKESEKQELASSGLCGLWEDERSPDEIIDDIYSHRTGFGNRKIEL